MYALVSTLFVLGVMSLGLPTYLALCHDLDKLAEHRREKARKAMRRTPPRYTPCDDSLSDIINVP